MLSMAALLLRGIAVGAFAVTALGVWRSGLSRDARLATGLTCLGAAAWTLTASGRASASLDIPYPLAALAFPAAGFFWAFVTCVFQDRPLRWWAFAPAAALLALGVAATWPGSGANPSLLAAFNLAAAALALHAMVLI
ncbi:MAG TPA: hypothetical protein VF495_28355, partial [Phenylobacterium sp.]